MMKTKSKLPKPRCGLFVLARKRAGGPMKDRREKRKNRNTWKKEQE